jgi:hypothetical protein
MVKMKQVGRNVSYSVDGNTLTLEVDLNAKTEESASGKTQIVATTQGNKNLGDVFVGLNVFRYDKPKNKSKK